MVIFSVLSVRKIYRGGSDAAISESAGAGTCSGDVLPRHGWWQLDHGRDGQSKQSVESSTHVAGQSGF